MAVGQFFQTLAGGLQWPPQIVGQVTTDLTGAVDQSFQIGKGAIEAVGQGVDLVVAWRDHQAAAEIAAADGLGVHRQPGQAFAHAAGEPGRRQRRQQEHRHYRHAELERQMFVEAGQRRAPPDQQAAAAKQLEHLTLGVLAVFGFELGPAVIQPRHGSGPAGQVARQHLVAVVDQQVDGARIKFALGALVQFIDQAVDAVLVELDFQIPAFAFDRRAHFTGDMSHRLAVDRHEDESGHQTDQQRQQHREAEEGAVPGAGSGHR